MAKININQLVMGARSVFTGYGDNIASTPFLEKNYLNSSISWGQPLRSIMNGNISRNAGYDGINGDRKFRQVPYFWFIPDRERIVFLLYQHHYTCFPSQNRFYNQIVGTYFPPNELTNVNLGDFFSCVKFFRQYDQCQHGKLSDSLDIISQEISVSDKLVNTLHDVATTDKKLLIEIPDMPILEDNQLMDYLPFRKLFYGLSKLPVELRNKIGVSCGTPYEDMDIRLGYTSEFVREWEETIPAKDAYYTWDFNRFEAKGFEGLIAKIAHLFGKATFHPAEPARKEIKKEYKSVPPEHSTKILIRYGSLSEKEKFQYSERGFNVVGIEVLD